MEIRELKTTSDVIDEFGGTVAFSRLIGKSKQSVSNYRASGRFPPETFLFVTAELRRRRRSAAPSLWGMDAPARVSARVA
jgi:hypothetical protein